MPWTKSHVEYVDALYDLARESMQHWANGDRFAEARVALDVAGAMLASWFEKPFVRELMPAVVFRTSTLYGHDIPANTFLTRLVAEFGPHDEHASMDERLDPLRALVCAGFSRLMWQGPEVCEQFMRIEIARTRDELWRYWEHVVCTNRWEAKVALLGPYRTLHRLHSPSDADVVLASLAASFDSNACDR